MAQYHRENRQYIQDLNDQTKRERALKVLNGKFDDNLDKDRLRKELAEDQGYLCCYCMCKIDPESGTTRIEHWQSRHDHPELILTFENLLLACDGGENSGGELHCDASRHHTPLQIDPRRPNFCENTIGYDAKGKIVIRDGIEGKDSFEDDIERTLHLNTEQLKKARIRALVSLTESYKREGGWSRQMLERKLNRLLQLDKPEDRGRPQKLPPFYGILVFYLRKKIASNQ